MVPQEERNRYQIIRKDAKNCFVESLSDAFPLGKAHLGFATYDTSKPAGQRQTNSIHIYISMGEILELCRKLSGGEMRYIMQQKKQANDTKPIQEWLGGTSAKKLTYMGKPRKDGKSLSRTCKLLLSNRGGFLLVADSGPGDQDKNGLIVPRFGNNPENHVAISMTFEAFSEMLLMTQAHYTSWLSTWYLYNYENQSEKKASPSPQHTSQENNYGYEYSAQTMF